MLQVNTVFSCAPHTMDNRHSKSTYRASSRLLLSFKKWMRGEDPETHSCGLGVLLRSKTNSFAQCLFTVCDTE